MSQYLYAYPGLRNAETGFMADAACREADPAIFFEGCSRNEAERTEALSYCTICPVKSDCLNYAVDNNIEHGTWGGMNESDRFKYRRKLRAGTGFKRRAKT